MNITIFFVAAVLPQGVLRILHLMEFTINLIAVGGRGRIQSASELHNADPRPACGLFYLSKCDIVD